MIEGIDEYSKDMWVRFAAAALPGAWAAREEFDLTEQDVVELAASTADRMVEQYKLRRKAHHAAQDPNAGRRGK